MDLTKEERINLRLKIVPLIKNSDDYYKASLESQSVDFTKLTHAEVCVYKAAMDVIQADAIIDQCFLAEKTELESVYESLSQK